jgi:hypothetical protein
MVTDLKNVIIEKIKATEDELLLKLINDEIDHYKNDALQDKLDDLSEDDFKELKMQLAEPFDYETHSLDEFKEATKQWRTK